MPVSLIWHSITESISFNTIVKFPFDANILKRLILNYLLQIKTNTHLFLYNVLPKIGTNINFLALNDC
jgi:hypothetical protein